MSTKKIREALELLREAETCAGPFDIYVNAAASALAELRAIEKAARVVAAQGIYEADYDGPDERARIDEADDILTRVAKESGK